MDNTILEVLLTLAGSAMGTLGGILASQKLINYRIEQLEKKVDKHNNVIERVYKLEKHEAVTNEKIEHLEGFHQ